MEGSPGSRTAPRRRLARRGPLALAAIGVVAALAGAAFLLGARSTGTPARDVEPGAGAATSSGTPPSDRHVYLLQPAAAAPSRVSLEVAADEAARERGLSNRGELPSGTGMVGLFEMSPCRAGPCPTYAPARPYRYAVELPSGAFTAAGIREGDRVVPRDPDALPAPS